MPKRPAMPKRPPPSSTDETRPTDAAHLGTPRLDDQLCFALYGALQAMTRTYKPLLEPLGLTYSQYLVMLVLWEAGESAVRDIGARLNLDSGTLTPLLKRLESAGLVTRRRSAADERVVKIATTAAGEVLREPAAEVMRCIGAATGMDLADVVALREQLRALTRSLDITNS